MLRILQFADVHLGCSFSGITDQNVRQKLRSEQRSVFRAALEPARTGAVDVVLIPGDLLEHDRADLDTIRFVQSELEAVSPIPVLISPGNHDPCVRGSAYLSLSWPENVHIFTSPEFANVSICGGRATVFGIANCGEEDTRGVVQAFRADGDGLKIGLVHGSSTDCLPSSFADVKCLPFTCEDIKSSGFDYVAVGHYHSFTPLPSSSEPVACYSGCLQGTGWDEQGVKGVLIVELDSDAVKVTFMPIKSTSFDIWTIELGCVKTSEQVVDALRALSEAADGAGKVMRVVLRGEVDPDLELNIDEVTQRTADQFLYLSVDGEGLVTGYDFESIAAQDTVMGRIVREVEKTLQNIPVGSRERRVLEQARLYALRALSGREVNPR